MSDGIITPTAEISIAVLGREVVIVSLFRNEDGSTDVLCGVEDPGSADLVKEFLADASIALSYAYSATASRERSGDVPRVETGEAQHPF